MKILLISIDDVGLDLLAEAKTPTIDRLCNSGAVFNRFVAAPNCSNFRAKVETGLYSIRGDNLVGGIFDKSVTLSLPTHRCVANQLFPLAASQVGKWHLCAHINFWHRGKCGYTSFGGSQANLNPGTYWNWEAVINGTPLSVGDYATDWVADRAVSEMASGMFQFVNCAFNAVHKPEHVPPGMSEGGPKAMLEYLDGALIRVVEAALTHDFGIILCSDNGGTHEDGGKGSLSHKALATLLVTYNMPVVQRELVDATDLYATIVHGVTGSTPEKSDGVSLLSSLGRPAAFADKWGKVLEPPGPQWQEMATDGSLKVIRTPATGDVVATDWFDAPTTDDVSHLIAALDAR